jgi:hypothetical protein
MSSGMIGNLSISNGGTLGQQNTVAGLSPLPYAAQRFPIDDELLGMFKVYKIQNGYLLRYGLSEGDIWQTTYVGTADRIGEAVTSILVQRKLDDANNTK